MIGFHGVTVRHNFETAHRLPQLLGKCVSLHGHSWWVDVGVDAPGLDEAGTVVEFGDLKARLRQWLDANLDHGSMLGAADPLRASLEAQGCKVFVFGDGDPGSSHAHDLAWPTVENVATLLARVANGILAEGGLPHADGARVAAVKVRETHLNEALWIRP